VSIWSEEERTELDYVELKTAIGAAELTVRSPGVCKISGDGIPREWDVRQGFGLAGSTQAFRGLGLAEFEIAIRLWLPEHREQFQLFDAGVEPSLPGQPERVYKIKNPRLALRGIDRCVFLNAPLLRDGEDDSETATYKCRQWRKPLATLSAPTAPGAASAQGSAADEFAARIAARAKVLQDRFQQLFGGP
jgi:hypothetical protein